MNSEPRYDLYTRKERIEKVRSVLEKRQSTLTCVLENINDPHNVSACVRSMESVGIFEFSVVYHGDQKFPKLGRKSSASARKWVKMKPYRSIEKCYESLRSKGFKIYTTKMDAEARSLYDLDLTEPTAFVFGNEKDGVSEEAAERADGNVLIPQVGFTQSLNISVACAVSVFEAFRQRLAAGIYDRPQLTEDEIENYLAKKLDIRARRGR